MDDIKVIAIVAIILILARWGSECSLRNEIALHMEILKEEISDFRRNPEIDEK